MQPPPKADRLYLPKSAFDQNTGNSKGTFKFLVLVPAATKLDTSIVQFGKLPCEWAWLTGPYLAAGLNQDAIAPMLYVNTVGVYQYTVTIAWTYTLPAGATEPPFDVNAPLSLQLWAAADYMTLTKPATPCSEPVNPKFDTNGWKLNGAELTNANSQSVSLASFLKYSSKKKTWASVPVFQTVTATFPFTTKSSADALMALSLSALADIKLKTGETSSVVPSVVNLSLTRFPVL